MTDSFGISYCLGISSLRDALVLVTYGAKIRRQLVIDTSEFYRRESHFDALFLHIVQVAEILVKNRVGRLFQKVDAVKAPLLVETNRIGYRLKPTSETRSVERRPKKNDTAGGKENIVESGL